MKKYSVSLTRDYETETKEDAISLFCGDVSITEDDGFEVEEIKEKEYVIAYVCPECKHVWHEVWSCPCDSECKKCGMKNIQAYKYWETNEIN